MDIDYLSICEQNNRHLFCFHNYMVRFNPSMIALAKYVSKGMKSTCFKNSYELLRARDNIPRMCLMILNRQIWGSWLFKLFCVCVICTVCVFVCALMVVCRYANPIKLTINHLNTVPSVPCKPPQAIRLGLLSCSGYRNKTRTPGRTSNQILPSECRPSPLYISDVPDCLRKDNEGGEREVSEEALIFHNPLP